MTSRACCPECGGDLARGGLALSCRECDWNSTLEDAWDWASDSAELMNGDGSEPEEGHLLTNVQYTTVWVAGAAIWMVHSIGFFLGWWASDHFTAWLGIGIVLFLAVTAGVDLFMERRDDD